MPCTFSSVDKYLLIEEQSRLRSPAGVTRVGRTVGWWWPSCIGKGSWGWGSGPHGEVSLVLVLITG